MRVNDQPGQLGVRKGRADHRDGGSHLAAVCHRVIDEQNVAGRSVGVFLQAEPVAGIAQPGLTRDRPHRDVQPVREQTGRCQARPGNPDNQVHLGRNATQQAERVPH